MKKLIALAAFLGAVTFGAAGTALAQASVDTATPNKPAAAPAAPAATTTTTVTETVKVDAKAGTVTETVKVAEKKEEAKPAAPTPNKGDVTWMLVCTALVIMMSVPALALFYGGMVRAKNMLSVLMQVFVTFSLIVVLWCIYGYSLAFTEGNAFFGGFDRLFLSGAIPSAVKGEYAMAATFSKGVVIPEIVFVAFQATFAAITCCLIVGAFAERIKFSAVLIFMVIWFTFAYAPIAHMVWFWMGPDAYTDPKLVDELNAKAGFIWQWGALDFAGGTVVHINAGVAGLVGAYLAGKRIGFGREAMSPHNLPLTMIGASLLWVAGSASTPGPRSRPATPPRSRSSTPSSPPPARCCRGRSASGCSRASRRCSAPPPAQWRAWSRSRRPPATSASRARS